MNDLQRLQARVVELERWPDTGELMDNSSAESLLVSWRNRCLAAEHKNRELLAELARLRAALLEATQTVEA